MLKHIIGTFLANISKAAINLLLIIFTAHFFGAEGRGFIAMFMTNLAIIGLLSKFVGGSALVYLTPRSNPFQIAVPSYLWSVLIGVTASYMLVFLNQVAPELYIHLLLLAIIEGLASVNYSILGGKQEIKKNNLITVAQSVLIISSFILIYYLSDNYNIYYYIYSIYISYIFGFLISSYFVFPYFISHVNFKNFKDSVKKIVTLGSTAQLANLIQFLNFRLSYYFLNTYYNIESIGIYSVAMTLTESIWLICTSISSIQYINIANSDDKDYAKAVTKKLVRISFLISTFAVIILLLMPTIFFTLMFGPDFSDIKIITLFLSIGTISISIGHIMANYYMGIGMYKLENYAYSLGLILTVLLCYTLIPKWGIYGAALASSCSYLCTAMYLYYRFRKESGFSLKELKPTKKDIMDLIQVFKSKLKFRANP